MNSFFVFYENLLTNEIRIRIGNDFYKLGFENTFMFLNESQKFFLENELFNEAKKYNSGYVDSIVWYSFLATAKIELPLMKEKYENINFDNLNYVDMSIQKSGRNINNLLTKNDFMEKQDKNKKRPLFESYHIDLLKENMNTNKFCLISQKTIFYNNSIEFLVGVLHCIFSTNKRYYLKKCDRCEKYYITNKLDNKYCNRIYTFNNKNLSCSEISKILKKTYKYTQLTKKHRNLLQSLNKNKHISFEYIEQYKTAHKRIIKEYVKTAKINIVEDFLNTYIEKHPFNK